MRLLTGDECGLLKEYVPQPSRHRGDQPPSPNGDGGISSNNNSSCSSNTMITSDGIHRINVNESMSRRHGIVGLTWMEEDQQQNQFAALRIDGTVQVWEGKYNEVINNSNTKNNKTGQYRQICELSQIFANQVSNGITNLLPSTYETRAVGIHCIRNTNRLVACDSTGTIVVVNPFVSQNENSVQYRLETLNHNKSKATKHPSSNQSTIHNNDSNKHHHLTTPTVSAFACYSHWVAVGSKDQEMMVWDVSTEQLIWKSKNLPPDPQTLLQPRVYPTAAAFHGNLLAVGSAYHQVRIYDMRAVPSESTSPNKNIVQRRPIQFTTEQNHYLEHRITALCWWDNNSDINNQDQLSNCSHSNTLIVGDAGGTMLSLDLRMLKQGGTNISTTNTNTVSSTTSSSSNLSSSPVLGRFAGPAGSIRQIVQLSKQHLACVGLDRVLRIYNINTRKQIHQVYLKQRLYCVLSRKEKEEDSSNMDNYDFDDEYDGGGDDDGDDAIEQEDKVYDYIDSENDSNSLEDGIDEISHQEVSSSEEDEQDEDISLDKDEDKDFKNYSHDKPTQRKRRKR